MITPCEVAVKCALPSVRAMVASELMSKHSMSQGQAAELLGVSQPAISLYQKKLRGNSLDLWNDSDIAASVARQAEFLVNGGGGESKNTMGWFCGICKMLRAKGYLCKIHKDLDPMVNLDDCDFCKDLDPALMVDP
jgi:predicted transcriptional regulator